MVKVRKNLSGMTFGRLTVLHQTDDYVTPKGEHLAMWKCKCSCGEDYVAEGRHLKRGDTKSCGCYRSEQSYKLNKKYNDFVVIDDYVVMYTFKGEEIYVDLSEYNKVKDMCWHFNKYGYVVSGDGVYMHRLIMGEPNGFDVDHIGGEQTRCDNRKLNLRIATRTQNKQNVSLRSDNKSGVTGVWFNDEKQVWYASIIVNSESIWLGSYSNKEDAVAVRKKAENQFFGEFSYDNSQNLYNSRCCM